MKARVAIIGKGHVGGAIARGLQRVGYEVRAVGNDPPAARAAAAWGEVVILAVPFGAVGQVLGELGEALAGKVVVDVANPLTQDMQAALPNTTSSAEETQRQARGARVVKAFNTVFAEHMATGRLGGTPLTLFVAGDDAPAKGAVLALGRDIGFDAVDAGPLRNARYLEAMGLLNIQLGYAVGMGTQIGLELQHA